MKVISKAEILATTVKTKRDGFCTKCNKDAVKKAVSEAKEFDAIPLDRIKQAREEMIDSQFYGKTVATYNDAIMDCVKILDKLIESEEK